MKMKTLFYLCLTLMPLFAVAQDDALADVPLTLYAPNCFTPDNDGLNDAWGIDSAEEWDRVEISVYNEWGSLVWRTESIDSHWAGEYNNGDYFSPDDQYFYTVKATKNGQTIEKKGVINMIR